MCPPLPADAFWRENAEKLVDNNCQLLRVLLKLLETSRDSTTLAVGCQDLAQFVSHIPHGAQLRLLSAPPWGKSWECASWGHGRVYRGWQAGRPQAAGGCACPGLWWLPADELGQMAGWLHNESIF